MASNIGVQGSNPGRDCPVCEIFRMAKTDYSYVKIPTKTDQNDEKNVRALIGFGEVKATKTDDFLCLNPKIPGVTILIFLAKFLFGTCQDQKKSYQESYWETYQEL